MPHNLSRQTIQKWQNRDTPEDKSHAPNKMYTTLPPQQELIVVELRKTLLLPKDDLLAVTHEFINAAVSRAGLGCLRRHGVSDLRDLIGQVCAAPATKKTFKDYEPGFAHIDIKYLPQMPDETARRYLFASINRATRWVFVELYADQTDCSSVDFLNKVQQACPVKIVKLLTDNGSQFTDRLTAGGKTKEPSGMHLFDRLCKQLGIEHRLIPPRHPQTNGMVERFDGRISNIVNQTRFRSRAELEATLRSYVRIYNRSIPQRGLKHKTPIQALEEWTKNVLNCSRNVCITKRVLTPREALV